MSNFLAKLMATSPTVGRLSSQLPARTSPAPIRAAVALPRMLLTAAPAPRTPEPAPLVPMTAETMLNVARPPALDLSSLHMS